MTDTEYIGSLRVDHIVGEWKVESERSKWTFCSEFTRYDWKCWQTLDFETRSYIIVHSFMYSGREIGLAATVAKVCDCLSFVAGDKELG